MDSFIILAGLNNAVVWIVSARPPISKSSRPLSKPLGTVPRTPITIGIIVILMFDCFPSSLARSKYLRFRFFKSFLCSPPGWQNKRYGMSSFFFFFFVITKAGKLARVVFTEIRDSTSPHFSKNLLSIQANLKGFNFPWISSFRSLFQGIVLKSSTVIGITISNQLSTLFSDFLVWSTIIVF